MSTLALLAVGGGAAFAAPAVRSIFDPDITTVRVRIEATGSTKVHCASQIETSIKLGDVDRHQATMRAFKRWVDEHPLTVRVPHEAKRLEVLTALSRAEHGWLVRFDRSRGSESLEDAADVFSSSHCTGGVAR